MNADVRDAIAAAVPAGATAVPPYGERRRRASGAPRRRRDRPRKRVCDMNDEERAHARYVNRVMSKRTRDRSRQHKTILIQQVQKLSEEHDRLVDVAVKFREQRAALMTIARELVVSNEPMSVRVRRVLGMVMS